ncbi:type II toxin-antitoxin system CcdA family antitoxin [Polynucleobacter sp. 78F-HAINBA]|jgi:antitoxin CcdA|uniref:type II toxin-antitoxin system CcdA family antitoxin n=1 Tax=Polynucleobacter sp. 78F-HAINBA TaxID=2689099 RepID=UPI001C0E6A61|nr:type II toxin-antitoxin system CcdA family antitoxin [Polynucleobacter sp. 78F-HAINBA]MBU3591234.1 type II toxin-antitoxin system CcdA family antitoxin [Polynucleobacter sp. 78F-HAINBA]
MIIHDSTRTQDKVLKKATNLTLNTEVLAEAKKLGINISKACDAFLESLVRQEKERLWKLENADFIASYNKTIEDEGLPLDSWRTF